MSILSSVYFHLWSFKIYSEEQWVQGILVINPLNNVSFIGFGQPHPVPRSGGYGPCLNTLIILSRQMDRKDILNRGSLPTCIDIVRSSTARRENICHTLSCLPIHKFFYIIDEKIVKSFTQQWTGTPANSPFSLFRR